MICPICNTKHIKAIKTKAIDIGLPLLARKWDTVDLGYTSIQERTGKKLLVLKKMMLKEHKKQDIAAKLGVCRSAVSNMIKRHRDELEVMPYVR